MTGPRPGLANAESIAVTGGLAGNSQDCLGLWGGLVGGERVEIVREGLPAEFGIVDAVMPDGSVVWLWMDSGRGRTMLLAGDGLCLRRTEPHVP